jgi:hypothetical protein
MTFATSQRKSRPYVGSEKASRTGDTFSRVLLPGYPHTGAVIKHSALTSGNGDLVGSRFILS